MYIDMGERIAGKQDRSSLIICISTVMRSAFADILVPPVPGFYLRVQHDPKFFFFIFFILTQKVLIRLPPYLTCKLI